MKKAILLILALYICSLFCGCDSLFSTQPSPGDLPYTDYTQGENSNEDESDTVDSDQDTDNSQESDDTQDSDDTSDLPQHSPLYIEGLDVEDVITYFNEVVLAAEYSSSGDPSLVQKWADVIYYRVYGEPTDEDMEVLNGFVEWLNDVEGFPRMRQSSGQLAEDLSIHFCSHSEMADIMDFDVSNADGTVTFNYNGNNEIFTGTICYRTDLEQHTRNSVILEEIYNGLGPVQDSDLREDSIIYSGFSTPQELTAVDELILKLLYHPDIQCGMNARQCERIIRQLYY